MQWHNGHIQRLTNRYGQATAVNNRGQVAGFLYGPSFLWHHGTLTQIGPTAGAMYTVAEAIDRDGRIAGHTDHRAFIWHNGTFTWLPGLTPATSIANDITSHGHLIVGSSATTPTGLNSHAATWTRR